MPTDIDDTDTEAPPLPGDTGTDDGTEEVKKTKDKEEKPKKKGGKKTKADKKAEKARKAEKKEGKDGLSLATLLLIGSAVAYVVGGAISALFLFDRPRVIAFVCGGAILAGLFIALTGLWMFAKELKKKMDEAVDA